MTTHEPTSTNLELTVPDTAEPAWITFRDYSIKLEDRGDRIIVRAWDLGYEDRDELAGFTFTKKKGRKR